LLVYPDKAKALPWEKNVLTPSRSYSATFYRESNAIDELNPTGRLAEALQ